MNNTEKLTVLEIALKGYVDAAREVLGVEPQEGEIEKVAAMMQPVLNAHQDLVEDTDPDEVMSVLDEVWS